MRNYLYFWFGIIGVILGWSVSQFVLFDLQPIWSASNFTFFLEYPQLVKLTIISSFLALFMVMAEAFLSQPTRIKAALRVLRSPLLIALILGIISGLLSTGISTVIRIIIPAPAFFIRLLDWILIGLTVGLAEGLSWCLRILIREKPDFRRVKERLRNSLIIGTVGSIVAFFLSEIYPKQDIVSFIILGGVLGVALSFTSSPSYQIALRAGAGFEPTRSSFTKNSADKINGNLKFTNDSRNRKIEEGLSIQLTDSKEVLIGSGETANIYVSDLPPESAKITIRNRKAWISPCGKNNLIYRNRQIFIAPCSNPEDDLEEQEIKLLHNQIITLKCINTTKRKYVSFVFYDRFLDPEA
ncbi:MAG: hypothetical protein RMZ69_19765 [Nostoc sp. ChiQUE01a]|nr:hypothetical protein [Nostoc sp. ChiQUE01a]